MRPTYRLTALATALAMVFCFAFPLRAMAAGDAEERIDMRYLDEAAIFYAVNNGIPIIIDYSSVRGFVYSPDSLDAVCGALETLGDRAAAYRLTLRLPGLKDEDYLSTFGQIQQRLFDIKIKLFEIRVEIVSCAANIVPVVEAKAERLTIARYGDSGVLAVALGTRTEASGIFLEHVKLCEGEEGFFFPDNLAEFRASAGAGEGITADGCIGILPGRVSRVTLSNMDRGESSNWEALECDELRLENIYGLKLADLTGLGKVSVLITDASPEGMTREGWSRLPETCLISGALIALDQVDGRPKEELVLDAPNTLSVGSETDVEAWTALYFSGEPLPPNITSGDGIAPLSELELSVTPEERAVVSGTRVRALAEGSVEISAVMGAKTASSSIMILPAPTAPTPSPTPVQPTPTPAPAQPDYYERLLLEQQWNAWLAYVRHMEYMQAQQTAQQQAAHAAPQPTPAPTPSANAAVGETPGVIAKGTRTVTVTGDGVHMTLKDGSRVQLPRMATLALAEQLKSGAVEAVWGGMAGTIAASDAKRISVGKALSADAQWAEMLVSTTVREKPSSSGKPLGRAAAGMPVLAASETARPGWTAIIYNGRTAYVRESYLNTQGI